MKTKLHFVVLGAITGLALGASDARANLEVSAAVSIHATADFYAPLEPEGAWIEVGSYGRCWHPAHVAVGWRPYCYGHWVWTDCGWYWESDEPWAWACYHYGWWVYDPVVAWVWVPGIEWAPAWVSWRVGVGHIGWAPLAPRGVVVAGPQFVFVASDRFTDPVRPSTVIVNNTRIINETRIVNNVKRETVNIAGVGSRQVVYNEGPGLATVQRATKRKIEPMPIEKAVRQTRAPAALSKSEAKPGKVETRQEQKFAPLEPSVPSKPEPKFAPLEPSAPGKPQRKFAPAERSVPGKPQPDPRESQPKRESPGFDRNPPPHDPSHPAERPSPSEGPPGRGQKPPPEKGSSQGHNPERSSHGKGHDRESEGHGKPQD